MKLPVNEIFTSIDGEVNQYGQGKISTFIRLAGCNLRCSYCDTEKALSVSNGTLMSIDEICNIALSSGCKKITITGGEPLIHGDGFYHLVEQLFGLGCKITVETNGSILPENRIESEMIGWVFDYKLPSSGMMDKMPNVNLFVLKIPRDGFVKMVVGTKQDFVQALSIIKSFKIKWNRFGQYQGPVLALSPCMGRLEGLSPEYLVKLCIEHNLFDIFINAQIHKFLFPKGEVFSLQT